MAGATAFFAFFALPSIVVILSQVLSPLFNNRDQAVSGRLFTQLAKLFGPHSARQLQDISNHLQPKYTDLLLTIVSVVILLMTATTLFAVMKNSLNQLWNVKVKPGGKVVSTLRDRGIALSIIIGSGLLFTVSITIGHALFIPESSPNATVVSIKGLSNDLVGVLLSIGVLTTWFAMMFTYLPDVQVRWSAVWVGAFVTSILYTFGEWVLTRMLTYGQLRLLHGGAGAFTLILLFVFYCSLIFYFGAAFTRQYAEWAHLKVAPNDRAVEYTITDVEE